MNQQQQDDDDETIVSKIEANDMIETTNRMITAKTAATGSSDKDDDHKRLRVLESSVFEKLFVPLSP